MSIHPQCAPVRSVLCGALLALFAATASAQVQTGTSCTALEQSERGPVSGTASRCENTLTIMVPDDPPRTMRGSSRADSRIDPGVWQVRASAESDGNGIAESRSGVSTESSLSVQSTDPSRRGEQVYVTFGAPWVEVHSERETVEPPPSDTESASGASTKLNYSFYMFTLTSGSTLEWNWTDDALAYNSNASFGDVIRHEVTGDLGSRVVPMLLGEGAWFRLSLSAFAYAQGTAQARVGTDQAFHWGGITSVVDAAGRPVDYFVPLSEGMDWGRSFVPDLATPVPEPGVAVLLGLGVAMLSALARWGDRRLVGYWRAAPIR